MSHPLPYFPAQFRISTVKQLRKYIQQSAGYVSPMYLIPNAPLSNQDPAEIRAIAEAIGRRVAPGGTGVPPRG